jgi:hypothetical protein
MNWNNEGFWGRFIEKSVSRLRGSGKRRALGSALCGVIALTVSGCGSSNLDGQENVASQSSQALTSSPQLYGQRKLVPSQKATALAAPNLLVYSGGRVVSNMQVVEVLYGTGSYLPQIANVASPSVGTFYQGVLNSPYVAWLTEYNTTAPLPLPRTNQLIGNGSFSSLVTITPSAANNGAVIDSSNVEAEISAQIAAGTLPAPTVDAQGNNNTYYSVFFPHGKVETLDNFFTSCSDFCAFHGTIANAGGKGEVYYGVEPDFQAGSGCEIGCGAAPTAFGNVTQVASHEMVETITDAEIGIGVLAWDDIVDNDEIGDLCNDQHGTIVGSDGLTYDVQTEYDNATGNCIVSKAANQAPIVNAGPDQTIALPAAANLNGVVTDDGLPNPPGTVTTTWTKVSGPGTVTFGNANAKVTTATFSTAGTYVLRLTANDSVLQASDDVQITVTGAATPCSGLCANPTTFTINGSFQSGQLGTGAVCLQTTAVLHGGNCGNFVSPRTLSVNGTVETCNNQNWTTVPRARNGGYCIQTTAGNQPWAYVAAF